MKTAALLPIHDDPLSLRFWLENYERVWAGEVDELVILISGPSADKVPAEGTNVRVIRHPGHIIHTGNALEELVASTDADALMLCEDDAYVRTPGIVRDCFARLEDECDVIGSPREPASAELIAVSRSRFGYAEVDGDGGNAFWPCFLFIRRDALERTDGNFGPTLYQRGEYVPGLDHTVTEETASDETFVGVSWQLRDNDARIALMPQYRSDSWVYGNQSPPWFHVGSLSAGAGLSRGKLDGDEETNFAHIRSTPLEFARRVSWWRRFVNTAPPSKVRTRYSKALERVVVGAGIEEGDIRAFTRVFDPYVDWAR